MIFVTVGSSIGGAEFDRLIKKVDDIAPHFKEEIIVQLGASQYIPKNMKWFYYVPYLEAYEYYKKAKLIIGHCGSGTIINALSFGKLLIVVPRLVKFNENTNDHQLEIARLLERNDFVRVVYDIDDLESTIRKTLEEFGNRGGRSLSRDRENLISKMKEFLSRVER